MFKESISGVYVMEFQIIGEPFRVSLYFIQQAGDSIWRKKLGQNWFR